MKNKASNLEVVTKRGGPRTGAGRKAVEDKKEPYTFYIRGSVVKKNGGEDKMKAKIYKHIGQKD